MFRRSRDRQSNYFHLRRKPTSRMLPKAPWKQTSPWRQTSSTWTSSSPWRLAPTGRRHPHKSLRGHTLRFRRHPRHRRVLGTPRSHLRAHGDFDSGESRRKTQQVDKPVPRECNDVRCTLHRYDSARVRSTARGDRFLRPSPKGSRLAAEVRHRQTRSTTGAIQGRQKLA